MTTQKAFFWGGKSFLSQYVFREVRSYRSLFVKITIAGAAQWFGAQLGAVILLVTSGSLSAASPDIVCDFGRVAAGCKVTTAVKIRNTTGEPLTQEKITRGCTCTEFKLFPNPLKDSAEGTLLLSILPRSEGPFMEIVAARRAKSPDFAFRVILKGEAASKYRLEPPSPLSIRVNTAQYEKGQLLASVLVHAWANERISDRLFTSCDEPWLSTRVLPVSEKTARIELLAKDKPRLGTSHFVVLMRDSGGEEVQIHGVVDVEAPIPVEPRELNLGLLSAPQTVSKEVRLGDIETSVVAVRLEDLDNVKATYALRRGGDNVPRLTLNIRAEQKTKVFGSVVVVVEREPFGRTEFALPVRAIFY